MLLCFLFYFIIFKIIFYFMYSNVITYQQHNRGIWCGFFSLSFSFYEFKPLELKLELPDVVAGNQAWVLYTSSTLIF